MTIPIRVLIVEDNPDDAELMMLRLSDEGYLVDGERVEDEPGYVAALEPRPDVILADWSMPHFSGLRALHLLREYGLDSPLIIVSGTLGEEKAVEALHHGATDYVLKQRLNRLGPAVRRALREVELAAERRRAEEALRKSQVEALRLARENATVARVGKIVSSSPDLDVALQEFTREMNGILPFDRLSLCLVYATGYVVNELYAAGIVVPGQRTGETLTPQGTLTEEVIRSRQGRIVHMDDRETTGQRFPGLLPVYDGGLRSAMAVPLVSRDHAIGVIHFESLSQGFYEDAHLRLAEGITSQIAGAIDNARLFKEHRQVSRALFESQKKYQELFHESPVGYHEVDAEGRIVHVNQTELDMLGYASEEMVGHVVWEFIVESEEALRVFLERVSGERFVDYEFERAFLRKDGTSIPVLIRTRPVKDAQGRIVGMRSTVQDITERKKADQERASLQDQLRQAQRMEAIGQLAGGVAHDFNNLLTVIKGYCQLAMEDLREEDPLRENLDQIFNAGTRAANLTRQLLAFSRRQVLEFKTVDLNELVGDIEKMLRRLLGEDIEFILRPGENLNMIRTDPGQMEQVLLNLVVNARDAMPLGGRLVIETGNVSLDDGYCRTHPDVSPGDYVSLIVSDTGCGMTTEIRERVFEPFFTTKEKGKGTGLGLSTVYGIVKQSGGHISIDSEPGQGATFRIHLPRTEEAPEEDRAPVQEPSALTGTGTVLVVEDEEVVRKLVTRILRKQGYRVLEASNGGEALLICEQHEGPIDLILTDVVMPGISGSQFVERLRQSKRDFAVLYMSGYTDDAIDPHGVLQEGVELLPKPFTTESLVRKVREVLDHAAPSGGRKPPADRDPSGSKERRS